MTINTQMKVTIEGCENKAIKEELERYIRQENEIFCDNLKEYAAKLEVLYALCKSITEKGTSDEEIY